jgi:hypothetical protein
MNQLDLIDLLKIHQYRYVNLNLDNTYDYTHEIGFDNKQLNGLYFFNPMVKCDDLLFLTMKRVFDHEFWVGVGYNGLENAI